MFPYCFPSEHTAANPIELNPVYFANSTLFTNCNRQHSFAFNPSSFLMKLGFFYELGSCLLKNFGRQKVFKNDLLLPFNQIFMHQCPNPESSKWSWGQSTWHIIEKKLQEAVLFKDNRTVILRRGNEATREELLCFEDLYLSVRSNRWLQGTQNLINFRKEAAQVTGEPEEAGRIYETPVPVEALSNGGRKYQHYCNRNYTQMILKGEIPSSGTKPTNARIKIFQRTETNAPRSFVNLEEVKSFLQQYTTVPISVITTTEKQRIQEQIRLFNSFDILVTVHGSHLTNGVYMMKPHTKVIVDFMTAFTPSSLQQLFIIGILLRQALIEVAPFLFDSVYFKNFNQDLGIAEYIISTGNNVVCPNTPASFDRLPPKFAQGIWLLVLHWQIRVIRHSVHSLITKILPTAIVPSPTDLTLPELRRIGFHAIRIFIRGAVTST